MAKFWNYSIIPGVHFWHVSMHFFDILLSSHLPFFFSFLHFLVENLSLQLALWIVFSISEIKTEKTSWIFWLIRLIGKKNDLFLRNCVLMYLPFIDERPGFVQVFFSQISPIGQSVLLSHWTEISPTSLGSRFRKFGPMKQVKITKVY